MNEDDELFMVQIKSGSLRVQGPLGPFGNVFVFLFFAFSFSIKKNIVALLLVSVSRFLFVIWKIKQKSDVNNFLFLV